MLKTEAGVVVGTAAYMSPEQARGQEVDARTDIWSLGVLLYEMVAGRSPFAAPSGTEVLAAILERDPPPLARFEPDTPAELQRIVDEGLAEGARAAVPDRRRTCCSTCRRLREDLAAASSVRQPRQAGHERHTAQDADASSGVEGLGCASAGRLVARRSQRPSLVVGAAVGAWCVANGSSSAQPRPSQSAPVQRNLTRLTFGPGLQTESTFSPDGRFIAYASDPAGNFDIWVQPVAGGDPVQVTRSVAQDTQPDWSPDGSTLVFRSERDGGGLFLVPALGGVERQLTSFGSYPFWSPDSSEILFMDEARSATPRHRHGCSSCHRRRATPREILADFFGAARGRGSRGHPDGRISALGRHRQLGSRASSQ